jgi:hypothetical protein
VCEAVQATRIRILGLRSFLAGDGAQARYGHAVESV